MPRQLQLPLAGLEGPARRGSSTSDRRRPKGDVEDRRGPAAGGRRAARPVTSALSRARYGGPEDWRMDERIRAAGRRGLVVARAMLEHLVDETNDREASVDAA